LGLAAWVVITAIVAGVVVLHELGQGGTAGAAAQDSLNVFLVRAQGRYLLGVRELLPAVGGGDDQLYQQVKVLNTGPVDQRLRAVVLAGGPSAPPGARGAPPRAATPPTHRAPDQHP